MVPSSPHFSNHPFTPLPVVTMRIAASAAALLALGHGANAAFGLTSTTIGFKVDTDGGLVFEVNK
jgi:hypothetical protein